MTAPAGGDGAGDRRLVQLGLDELPDASLMIFDTDMRYVMVRGAAVRENGMDPDELEGGLAAEVLGPERWAFYQPRYQAALAGETTSLEVRSPDGRRIYVVRVGPVRENDGRIVGGAVTATEVTTLRRAEQQRQESDRRFRLAMESTPIGMALVSLDRCFLEVNRALATMLGSPADQLISRSLDDFIHPDDRAQDLALRRRALDSPDSWASGEKRLIDTAGDVVWVQHSVGVMYGDQGEPDYFVSQLVNTTEARRAREELQQMALQDPLTELANRAGFIAAVEADLTQGSPMGLLYADLNGFKQINDSRGHAVGDQVLAIVAQRLAARLRADDVIARFGGDEFVVAVHGDADQLAAVAGHLTDSLAEPVRLPSGTMQVGISIGAAMRRPGESLDDALARADAALYRVKSGDPPGDPN